MCLKKAIIFAIDGILADISHRYVHSDYSCDCFSTTPFIEKSRFHTDQLLLRSFEIYKFFSIRRYPIYIFTSRSKAYEKETKIWLDDHNIHYFRLEMRKSDDLRPSYKVKNEYLVNSFKNPEMDVKSVFESDNSCVEMYRSYQLKVYDCASF